MRKTTAETAADRPRWKCIPCKGRGVEDVYYRGVPYPQGITTCGHCRGRGWRTTRPRLPWNRQPFELKHASPRSRRHLLHPARLQLEEEMIRRFKSYRFR